MAKTKSTPSKAALAAANQLAETIDHDRARLHFDAMALCEEARGLIDRGWYSRALENTLPMTLIGDDLIVDRARELSIIALACLADETAATDDDEQRFEHLNAWRRLSPYDPEPIVRMGEAFVKIDRYAQARSCFRKALALKGDHFGALKGMVGVEWRAGQKARCIQWAKKCWDAVNGYGWMSGHDEATAIKNLDDLYALTLVALLAGGKMDEAFEVGRMAKEEFGGRLRWTTSIIEQVEDDLPDIDLDGFI